MISMIRAKRIERLVKRKPTFRVIEETDWPVIAVAYDRGAFDFEKDLTAVQLRQHIEAFVQQGYILNVLRMKIVISERGEDSWD